jgi:hypothetical protein
MSFLKRESVFQFSDRLPWAAPLVLAALVAMSTLIAAWQLDEYPYGWAMGAALVPGLALLLGLVFGPSRAICTVFLVYMIASHQFRSFAIFPFANVEWHPRELLLFVLLAHFGAVFMKQQADLRIKPMHPFFLCYILFFVFIAARGLARGNEISGIIGECRYPIYLASFFVFTTCVHSVKELGYYIRLVFWLSLFIAVAAIAFFVYTYAFDAIINAQNVFGEFVPRLLGPLLLQSVRPNGHLFFEVSVVVLISLLLCPDVPRRRKAAYSAALLIFLTAIAITMMRTAYIALLISLAALALVNLQRELQVIAVLLGMVLAVLFLAFFGMGFYEHVLDWLPGMEVSLRGRFVEIYGAFQEFLRDPILGGGMGSKFEGMGFVAKQTLESVGQQDYQTVHNVWMYFLFKGGLVGIGIVLTGLGGMLFRADYVISLVAARADRFFLRGLLAAWAGQLSASLAMPRLTYPIGGVFMSMMACVFVVYAREATEMKPDFPRAPE